MGNLRHYLLETVSKRALVFAVKEITTGWKRVVQAGSVVIRDGEIVTDGTLQDGDTIKVTGQGHTFADQVAIGRFGDER